MIFKEALVDDTFRIMELYQRAESGNYQDLLFLDYKKLQEAIALETGIWMIADSGHKVAAVVSGLIDPEQGICKITRIHEDKSFENSNLITRQLLRAMLELLKEKFPMIDLAYTSTFTMSMEHQRMTLDEGFKVLGIFPNAQGLDASKLNGLTGYFFNKTLEKKRDPEIRLHPKIMPFYEITRKQCGLPMLSVKPIDEQKSYDSDWNDVKTHFDLQLELIEAPKFIEYQFEVLKSRRSQVINFYPFHLPNAMVTSPDQQLRVFIKLDRMRRSAAIIGEHLIIQANPVEIYIKTLELLKASGAYYVELINDAADVHGTECILRAGFTPTAYVPAFKKQGNKRRDYVVFGRTYEYSCRPSPTAPKPYAEFFNQYYELEMRNYFSSELIEES